MERDPADQVVEGEPAVAGRQLPVQHQPGVLRPGQGEQAEGDFPRQEDGGAGGRHRLLRGDDRGQAGGERGSAGRGDGDGAGGGGGEQGAGGEDQGGGGGPGQAQADAGHEEEQAGGPDQGAAGASGQPPGTSGHLRLENIPDFGINNSIFLSTRR